MTVATTVTRNDYTANGTQTAFPYGFLIFDQSELSVYVDAQLQILGAHYNVSGVGIETGGNVTFLTAPPAGKRVAILSKIAQIQNVNYVTNDNFPASSHEKALDKLTRLVHELKEELGRALRQHPADSAIGTLNKILPKAIANRFLAWNATATAIENKEGTVGGPASQITVTPAGGISSTDVQSAIQELDAEKLAIGGPAVSVANTPAGDIAATNVQAAINELDSEKASRAGQNTFSNTNTFTGVTTVNTVPTPASNNVARIVDVEAAAVNPNDPIFNANKLRGKPIATTTPVNGQVYTYNLGADEWQPLTPATGGGSQVLSTITGKELATLGVTTLYVASTNQIVRGVAILITAATGTPTPPVLGIGVAAGEEDILPSQQLTGLNAVDEIWHWTAQGISKKVSSGQAVKLGIDTAATASLIATIKIYGEAI